LCEVMNAGTQRLKSSLWWWKRPNVEVSTIIRWRSSYPFLWNEVGFSRKGKTWIRFVWNGGLVCEWVVWEWRKDLCFVLKEWIEREEEGELKVGSCDNDGATVGPIANSWILRRVWNFTISFLFLFFYLHFSILL
jgi:hypothetical protein